MLVYHPYVVSRFLITKQSWGYMKPNTKTCKHCKGQGTMADGTGCAKCSGSGLIGKAMPEPTEQQQTVIAALEQVLGDVAIMYFHAHGYHWNVQGQDFSQYHALFASIYEDVYGSIDPFAENILKLGGEAPRSLTQILADATMNDQAEESNDPEALASDLAVDNDAVIASLNELFAAANDANEQGIANFTAERIDQHQKWGWQLKASGDVMKCSHEDMKIGKKCPDCGYIKKMGDVSKGDKQGHAFRGNQYTRGKSGGRKTRGPLPAVPASSPDSERARDAINEAISNAWLDDEYYVKGKGYELGTTKDLSEAFDMSPEAIDADMARRRKSGGVVTGRNGVHYYTEKHATESARDMGKRRAAAQNKKVKKSREDLRSEFFGG